MDSKGVVMKVADRTAVVMTQSGAFVRVTRRPEMEVGMEVSLPAQRRPRRVPVWQRAGAAVAAAGIVLAAGMWFGIGQMGDDTAYAYVSVDINPSLAFTINQSQHVMSVTGLNADGVALAAQLHVDHEALKTALQTAINTAVSKQMLPNQDTILVTSAPATNKANAAAISQSVKKDVQAAVAANPTAKQLQPHVYALQVSKPVWTAATKADVSPGKLASYLIAEKEGHAYSLPELQGEKLGAVLGESSQAAAVLSALRSSDTNELKTVVEELQKQSDIPAADNQSIGNSTVTANNQLGSIGENAAENGVRSQSKTQNHTHGAKKNSIPAVVFPQSNSINAVNNTSNTVDNLVNGAPVRPQSDNQDSVTIVIDGKTFHLPNNTTGENTDNFQGPKGQEGVVQSNRIQPWERNSASNGGHRSHH